MFEKEKEKADKLINANSNLEKEVQERLELESLVNTLKEKNEKYTTYLNEADKKIASLNPQLVYLESEL